MTGSAVVAMDAGGTRTRVLVCGTDGGFLSWAEGSACSPEQMPVEDCVRNAVDTIRVALRTAGLAGHEVCGLAAGIAGLTAPGDGSWAQEIAVACDIPGEGQFVGDQIIAQLGAFAGAPGIVYIAGTGSIVFGRTDSGQNVYNLNYGHYATRSPADCLALEAMMRVATGEACADDAVWLNEFLVALSVPDASALRVALTTRDLHGRAAGTASSITAAASQGTPLPRAVCDCAAEDLVRGVRLLVPEFGARPARVAPAGSVACSAYMKSAVRNLVSGMPDCEWMEPRYPPVVGAAILALRPFGFDGGDPVFDRLTGLLGRA